jgi:ribosomal protein S18 acetylase RimI-like enzyme
MLGASQATATALERLPEPALDPICQIEENLVEALAAWGRLPKAQARHEPDRLEYVTRAPYPLFNGVARARLPAEDLDRRIEDVLAPFRRRRLPMMWWVGPHSEPADLGPRLEAHGLIHAGGDVGMAMPLAALPGEAPRPEGFAIQAVEGREGLARWVETMAAGYGLRRTTRAAVRRLWLSGGLADGAHRHYLGLLEGRPVATAQSFVGAGVVGVYWVSTLPEARRRGIGTAMTHRALEEARGMGLDIGVLHATPMGVSLYERLGFRECCRIDHYVWPGQRLYLAALKVAMLLKLR